MLLAEQQQAVKEGQSLRGDPFEKARQSGALHLGWSLDCGILRRPYVLLLRRYLCRSLHHIL